MRNNILHKIFALGTVSLCVVWAAQAQSWPHSAPQSNHGGTRNYPPFPIPSLVDASDPMLPLPGELLKDPIKLHGACERVSIVEWKSTPGNKFNKPENKEAVALIDDYCNEAIGAFVSFARTYKEAVELNVTEQSLDKFYHRISLLPAVVTDHGTDPRALNDNYVGGRFNKRSAGGESIWGYTLEKNRISFIDNGVFTRNHTPRPIFKDTLVHELFHAMSIFVGTSKQWSDDDEERHAQKFEEYVRNIAYE
jgi:hypothetical protein